MAQMTVASINDLPDSKFAYIEPGGKKDAAGRTMPRSLRHFPIHDAAHVRNALARAPQSPFGAKAMPKIKAAARKFGIDVADDDTARAEFTGPQLFLRTYPLEDIRILSRAQGSEYSDGRTVEAVVAVFDRETEIHDGQGHYKEVIDPPAFNKAIRDSKPQGGRQSWRTSVFYNHGMTLYGTPSDRFSVPLGSPVEIRADPQHLLTFTRYNETPLADEILEAIRSGDITGHSFTGRIIRSNPNRPPRGGFQRTRNGDLPVVRRLELGLKEYGPTPFPAYADTAVLGIRSMLAGLDLPTLLSVTRQEFDDEPDSSDEDDEANRTDSGEPADSDTPTEGAVPDEPLDDGHLSRDSDMRRHAILQQIAAARRTRPGLAQKEKRS
jgi:HK97 family phage prohead protease